jgi:hypothetical protein
LAFIWVSKILIWEYQKKHHLKAFSIFGKNDERLLNGVIIYIIWTEGEKNADKTINYEFSRILEELIKFNLLHFKVKKKLSESLHKMIIVKRALNQQAMCHRGYRLSLAMIGHREFINKLMKTKPGEPFEEFVYK